MLLLLFYFSRFCLSTVVHSFLSLYSIYLRFFWTLHYPFVFECYFELILLLASTRSPYQSFCNRLSIIISAAISCCKDIKSAPALFLLLLSSNFAGDRSHARLFSFWRYFEKHNFMTKEGFIIIIWQDQSHSFDEWWNSSFSRSKITSWIQEEQEILNIQSNRWWI